MFNSTFWYAGSVVDVSLGPVVVEVAGPSPTALAFLPYQLGFTLFCFIVLGRGLQLCLRHVLYVGIHLFLQLSLLTAEMRLAVGARAQMRGAAVGARAQMRGAAVGARAQMRGAAVVAARNMDPGEREAHRQRCELCGRDGPCMVCPLVFGDISFETLKPKEKFLLVGPCLDEGPIRQLFERVSPLLDVTFQRHWKREGRFLDRFTIVVVRKIPGTKAARS
jgi:hypothetical protein